MGLHAKARDYQMDQSLSLLLIGTVHGDPQGYERAMKLLRQVQPDLVTVEVSRFSLRYRRRQEPRRSSAAVPHALKCS